MAVIWTPESISDLRRLFKFLEEKNPGAAKTAALHILQAADTLLDFPRLGKLMNDDSGSRELPASFGKRGYIIRYRLDDGDTPIIIRVWHFLEDRID